MYKKLACICSNIFMNFSVHLLWTNFFASKLLSADLAFCCYKYVCVYEFVYDESMKIYIYI